MQLVRTLTLFAAVCAAHAGAQDTSSPPPPASTPTPTAAPASSPAPTTAAPSTPATPAVVATIPPPGVATPSPDASAVATSKVDDDTFTRVQISPSVTNAELRMESTEKTTVGAGSEAAFSTTTVEKMRVLMGEGTERLQVQPLQSKVLQTLVIGSYNDTRSTSISIAGDGFLQLSSLSSLSFQNINFYKNVVSLKAPDSLAYLKIDNSNVEDLELKTTVASNLNQVEFVNSGFKALPFLLYQRKYRTPVKVNANVTIDGEVTPLSPVEYANAEHNVDKTAAAFVVFMPSCDGVSTRSVTDSLGPSLHIVCNDSSRVGVRTFAQPLSNVVSEAPEASTPAPTPRGSDSNTTLTVIVIVIAVIAAVLAYFVARRYFCTASSLSRSPQLNDRTVGLISKDETQHGAHNKLSFISSDDALRQIRLEQQDVSVTKSVGTGRLWVGDYAGRKVMIKRIEAESSDSYVTKALITQARALAPLTHANVVGLIGVTWVQGTDFGIVGEFMEKGTLKSVLMDLDAEFDLQSKLHMCLDIAQALAYLHSSEHNMYMKRLNSRKVLVNGAIECKLNLFECHPCTNKIEYPEVFGAGELAWEAPELITRTGVLDPRKINMFSLGVLMGEIMTRVWPYQSAVDAVGHTLADLELVKRIRRQERLMPHENRREFTELPAVLRDLVERCLSYQPLSRPTAEEVVQCLESVKDYSERVGSTTSL